MSKKIPKEGVCGLCGKDTKLSFEHVPPEKAFNNQPIFIQRYAHLFDEQSRLFGKKSRSNRGFGEYTLCEPCNNNTGDWYANDYGSWAHQGMKILTDHPESGYVVCNFEIRPLNVLKQIVTMFLSADYKSGILRSNKDLIEFVLERENKELPDRYKIYMYLNNSQTRKSMGYQVIAKGSSFIGKWAEFNFQPFGFLLCDDCPPAHEKQLDITFFKNYSYSYFEELILPLHYLAVVPDMFMEYISSSCKEDPF